VTFSLVACDLDARQWGVVVASKFPSVGAVVPWARGDVGAVATQSYANVTYGPDGLERLASGESAEDVVAALTAADAEREHRQLGIVDARGGAATFTGSECMSWAGGRTGPGYAAQGNILTGADVVDALADAFEQTGGTLAVRMLAALQAADDAGGDSRGRQAAALLIRETGAGYGGNHDLLFDLRVDDHPAPVPELRRLLDIHVLLFGKTPPEEFLALDGELRSEVEERLSALGHPSLESWAGGENLEERLDPSGGSIDPEVLAVLRRETAAS
jgi:uncharacterized Ntn-hydrolase superfamily protein